MTKRSNLLFELGLPDWLPVEPWKGFLDMRKKIRRPLTDYGKKLAIRRLDELRHQGQSPQAVLEQSILNDYQGLFEVKANGHTVKLEPEPENALDREAKREQAYRERMKNA